uniref:RlpA-like protein double-psi beta-barrel domain-containing protein n=1 Tax=Panagrolaimus sp. PS1159 TaxID=55785 RepID=A0AC35GUT8_9BILA
MKRYSIFLAAVIIINVSYCYEINKSFDGYFSYYNYGGFGACGNLIDTGSQKFAAVSSEWFTAAESANNDPICAKYLKVEYEGKIVKVPIKDKCFLCDKNHINLSFPAFRDLENFGNENIKKAIFTFTDC